MVNGLVHLPEEYDNVGEVLSCNPEGLIEIGALVVYDIYGDCNHVGNDIRIVNKKSIRGTIVFE